MMAVAPFEDYERQPRWRLVYNLLVTRDIGDLITYEELGQVLGLHPKDDRNVIQQTVSKAGGEYLRTKKRALTAVRGKGYRVVEPEEQLGLAQTHQQRSNKALERAQDQLKFVDRTGMSVEVQKRFDAGERVIGVLLDAHIRMDLRQQQMEAALATVSTLTERTQDEVAALKERLARLEGNQQPE